MIREEIESKISEYATKLNNLSNEDKRVKKRVLQQLGKLKKQLNEIDNNTTEMTINSPLQSSNYDNNGSSALLTKGHAKMKLKLLNKELAQLAKKKQLKLAIKRFSWGVNKGLPVNVHTYSNLLNAYVRCGDIDGMSY